jgi:tyrosine-protein kinase Etk/Wzc
MTSEHTTSFADITLTDVLVACGEEKKTLLAILCLGTALALGYAFTVDRLYSASTVILPPQQQQSTAAAALAQLGALGSAAGAAIGGKTPDETYVALLQSRAVQDALIERFQLRTRYAKDSQELTREALSRRVDVSVDKKSGLLTIIADDLEPAFAAQLANAHFTELKILLNRIAVTDAQQRRVFFEQQVQQTQKKLNDAELRFRAAQSASGLVVTQALAETGIKESAALSAQIAARETELQVMSRFATAANPDVKRLAAELSALRAQLSKREQGAGSQSAQPTQGNAALQAFRDVKVQEALLETMIRQLELARADEAKEGPLLQQVDVAQPPERATKPRRSSIVLSGVFLSAMLAFLMVALRRAGIQHAESMRRIRQSWRPW